MIGIALALASCGSSDLLGPRAIQGIDGLVMLGPQCPVHTVDDPCPDIPYQAWIDIRNATGGAQVTRVRSDGEGRFRVGLRPGSYVLAPESGSPFPAAGEQLVEVDEGVYTEVTISFDTGIR